ncbi:uncharacterized protein EI90DRAFT_3062113 [Cantharellus anzutake]|uniref:uncharacterized protein n=1 Tax=Cantharellus anzutake TaxID=1750568 RepID=UPI00190757A6|nr:uncharacterized protein EI90DRAFT_3062113 [Cantharellus anzutake]KAF8329819.1 hypothetical protein EI90DRAFT_3062113 [Cantharellus anzutake]
MAPIPGLHDTFGVLVICSIFSSFLLAVQHYQAYVYLKRFWRKDSRYLRYNVVAVTAIDTLHQIFCLCTLYLYLVSHFSTPRFIRRSTWCHSCLMTFAPFSYFPARFYARRCWFLNKKRVFLTGLIVFWAHVQLGSTATTVMLKTFREYIKPKKWYLPTLWVGSAAICDILITYSVVSQLMGSKTGFRTTDRGIKRLIAFTFSTGALNSILACSIIVTVSFGLNQRGNWVQHHNHLDSDWFENIPDPEKMRPSLGSSQLCSPTLNPSCHQPSTSNLGSSVSAGVPRSSQSSSD